MPAVCFRFVCATNRARYPQELEDQEVKILRAVYDENKELETIYKGETFTQVLP
eukprot:SAG22_NODE_85_length_21510_cov_6.472187_18_plen_54_part_00